MRFRLALPLILVGAAACFADTYPRQPAIDIQNYTFRIQLSDAHDEISGEADVSVRFIKNNVAEFWLDLASPSAGKGMTVTSVTSSGVAVPYTHQNDRLDIRLASTPRAGETRDYRVVYGGLPADGLHILKNKFGDRTFFSNNWPDMAHQWLPTVDHPSDKATSEFFVTAPARYKVVSNGRLVEERKLPGGLRLTHWKESVPICTWLDNIGVADFNEHSIGALAGIPLTTWVFPQDREAGATIFDNATRQSMEFFTSHIGPYPYEKLAEVEAAGQGGGMENASAIFYGEKAITGKPAFGLVSHEIAHQWFGDSVTEKDWDDVWLSEGFATYFSLLATEATEGRDAFVTALKAARDRIYSAEARMPATAVVQTKPWRGIPNQIVYQKGGWVLHMLRHQMGDEKFWTGIREYYRRYRDSNASTADFEKVMEASYGADLKWFFEQWLYIPGSPLIEGSWRYDPATKKINMELAQLQPGAMYRLPIDVDIDHHAKPQTVQMNRRLERFSLDCDQPPVSVEIDPDTWLLARVYFTHTAAR
jgi:aminopeptidase N